MIAAVGLESRKTLGDTKTERPREAVEVHTRILRLALGMEESRAYWEHVDPRVTPAARAITAFEQRWFGGKSLERSRYLIACFVDRFDAFPAALSVLRQWREMDLPTRQVICHWHLQLSDPLYRRFTGQHLAQRRSAPEPKIDRNGILRWIKAEHPDRWSDATAVQFASKLMSAASEAGLVSANRDPRTLLFPKVSDLALTYMMYLLRGVRFEGTLVDNPYLRSVGLEGGFLDQRLRNLAGLTFRRMAHLTELEWAGCFGSSPARPTSSTPSAAWQACNRFTIAFSS